AETGHAYGIQTDAGAEVLIHIGIDTVTLGQEVFQTQVTQGHRVKKGDLLGTFDRKAIKEAGLDSTVMVIITNTSSYLSVEPMMSDHNEITPEQIILNLNTPN
ncbi:MAG: PTS glucose transporter subunit IIA, partial [Enterococcus faecalis]|nr:PTS glucose transporter subunit IIA [Enterococcus faecalis]